MKLKPVEWLLIIYQIFLIVLILLFKSKVKNIDYKILIICHTVCILIIVFVFSHIQNIFFRNLYPLMLLPFFYKEIGFLNHILYALPQDELFISLDIKIFGENIGLTLCRKWSSKIIAEIMHIFYFSYYIINILPAVYYYFKDNNKLERYMFMLFFSFFVYYVIYIFYPVYGPEFYIGNYLNKTIIPRHIGGYYVTEFLRSILSEAEINGAAFPSSHVGIALFVLLFVRKDNFVLKTISAICFSGICFATVYCRAHYAVDVFAGIISGLIIYWIAYFVKDKLI